MLWLRARGQRCRGYRGVQASRGHHDEEITEAHPMSAQEGEMLEHRLPMQGLETEHMHPGD